MPAHLDQSLPECMAVIFTLRSIIYHTVRDSGNVGEETSKIKWLWQIYVADAYYGIEAGDSDLRAQAAR